MLTKILDILRAVALAVTAWLQGRRKREANAVRKAVTTHDRKLMNEIIQERMNRHD